jgi:hypothetical protein
MIIDVVKRACGISPAMAPGEVDLRAVAAGGRI